MWPRRYYRRRSGTMVRYEWLAAIKEKKIKIAAPWVRVDNPKYRLSVIKYTRCNYEKHVSFNIRAEVFRVRGTTRWRYIVGYRNHSARAYYRGFCYSKKAAFKKADKLLAKHNVRGIDEKGLARIKLFT